jgi:DNA-binding GntR family transcriptional regulator
MTTESPNLGQIERRSLTDEVYDLLYQRILSVDLPPGTKMSEADIAKQLGVSRQPVRDAFYRLAQFGFLNVQPQRATKVTQISRSAIERARFIRTSLELEVITIACEDLSEANLRRLTSQLDAQREAQETGDQTRFHNLDDIFHQSICNMIDRPYAWHAIREVKAHMDRARFLSHAFASQTTFDDHVNIVDALRLRDARRARSIVRTHLDRIDGIVVRLRAKNQDWFVEDMT